MAVEQGETGVISGEVSIDLAKRLDEHDILDHPAGWLTIDIG